MKLPINKIIVEEDRHRKQFTDIDTLANSIAEVGLIHPIVVEKKTKLLIAGERRLRACTALGWTEIEVTYKEDLDEWTLQAIQLEENIKRSNLTWQEEINAKLRLHELYQAKYGKTVEGKPGGHRLKDTATLLGEAEGGTKMDVALAKAILTNPELAKRDTKNAAYKAMLQSRELNLRSAIADILAEDCVTTKGEQPIQLILGDSLDVLKGYPDGVFDFSITDPPWGVNVDESVNLEEGWSDVRVDNIRGVDHLSPIFKELYRVLSEGAHCYVFYASMLHEKTKNMLSGCGFTVSPIPLIWYKTRGGNIDAYHRFTSTYEPIFFCHKGKPKTFGSPGMEDVLAHATPTTKIHPTQKPVPLLTSLINNASVPNEIGVDPFGGSGVFGVACSESGRRAVVIEKDKEYYTLAWTHIFTQPERGAE